MDKIVKYTPDELKRIGYGLVRQSKTGMKKAGALLIRSARESADQDFANRVKSRIQELITHRSNLHIALDKTLNEIALFDKRIKAVEAGEFSVGFDGNILYNDKSLQY